MKIAMLGLGAYAIALTKVLHNKKNNIVMWSKFKEEVDMVKNSRENSAVLPDIKLEEEIEITNDLQFVIKDAEVIIMAVPMFALRGICTQLKEIIKENQIICIVSKGVEKETYMFPSQVVFEELPNNKVVMVSGPSFAKELATKCETGLTVASEDIDAMEKIAKIFDVRNISIDKTTDILGVQICATTKNIYAILLGILSGKNKSESTKASVLALVINDSRKLLEMLGGSRKTAYMYAGLGDLLLTCMSTKSRNFTLGKLLGEGKSLEEALANMSAKTVEGLHSLESIYELLKITGNSENIKSITLLYNMLNNNENIDDELKYIAG